MTGFNLNLTFPCRQQSEPVSYILWDGHLTFCGYFGHDQILQTFKYYFSVRVISKSESSRTKKEDRRRILNLASPFVLFIIKAKKELGNEG